MVFYELVQNFQFKRSYNKNKFFQIRGSAPVKRERKESQKVNLAEVPRKQRNKKRERERIREEKRLRKKVLSDIII